MRPFVASLFLLVVPGLALAVETQPPAVRNFAALPLNTWVKLTPLEKTPVSPRLGYEGACVWDSANEVMIRYGGHNQGGGGEQHSEIWTFAPRNATWMLKEPNTSPPGICCGQQNVFDPVLRKYVRFSAASANHGWQWLREVYLNDASVWTYDLPSNTWRNMRPYPTAHPQLLRCASWDSEHQVIVMFGGEGSNEGTWVYDSWQNSWTKMNPANEPEPRSGGNMAYDAKNKVHVLFGSQFNDDKHTWVYSLAKNEWRDMQPSAMPPTEKNDAVLTYDAFSGKIVGIVQVPLGKDEESGSRLETWTYSVIENKWSQLKPPREPDPTGNRARQLMFAPQLGVALLENRPSNSKGPAEQQVWALRLAAADQKASTPPPLDLKVVTGTNQATLSWKRPPRPFFAHDYAIYRGVGEKPWGVSFERVKVLQATADTTTYEDDNLEAGKVYHYFVRSANAGLEEGPPSPRVSTQPQIVEDVVVSVLGKDRVEVAWTPPVGKDIVGYHIERAVVEVVTDDQHLRIKKQTPPLEMPSMCQIRRVGAFARLTTAPQKDAVYFDERIDLTKPQAIEGEPIDQRSVSREDFDASGRAYPLTVCAYRVRAVNALGAIGGASPAVLTIPSSPQHVFAKEEGTTCHVKWAANREKNIKGYRIYRMDGRFNNEPITRQTPEPITATTFSDPAAGKSSRRYYVVAVDALGQEGFPSSPVWFDREWQAFYKPFVGEWHQ